MHSRHLALFFVATAGLALGLAPIGCGSEDPYKAVPAYSGRKASLPAVPSLPSTPIKQGDAYTVYGAIHHLNSIIHAPDVVTKDITLVGYIVDTNIKPCVGDSKKNCAPTCAIHKTCKADPEGCTTEIPNFVIADDKNGKDGENKIRVMGFSSNFANLFEAINAYKNLKEPPDEKKVYKDVLWQVDAPFPLPNIGAKIKITGKYGVNFQKASTGVESDPRHGIMTFGKLETLEPSPDKLSLEPPKK